jgi:hypothetical protein
MRTALRSALPITPLCLLAIGIVVLLTHVAVIMGVALGCTPPLRPLLKGPADWQGEPFNWPVAVPADWPLSCRRQMNNTECWNMQRFCSKRDNTPSERRSRLIRTYFVIDQHAVGWPYRSMSATIVYSLTTHSPASCTILGEDDADYLLVEGWRKASLDHDLLLPTSPTWGLLGNTMVYAMLIYAPLFGVKLMRARSRIRRGLCPACGYDLRGRSAASDANLCPECGANA